MEQKYIVTEDKSMSNTDSESGNEEISNKSSYTHEVCFEVAKIEYEHTLGRSTKFDQKINFALAVYALMAPMLFDSIKIIKEYSPLAVFYYTIMIPTLLCFTLVVITLLRLLKTENILHYDLKYILDDKLYYSEAVVAVTYMCDEYIKLTRDNNELLNNKSKMFNRCIFASIGIVIAIFSLKIISKCFS